MVCKSVHHHTFKLIIQPDAEISQVYYLSFKYSSTCFGTESISNLPFRVFTLELYWSVIRLDYTERLGPAASVSKHVYSSLRAYIGTFRNVINLHVLFILGKFNQVVSLITKST